MPYRVQPAARDLATPELQQIARLGRLRRMAAQAEQARAEEKKRRAERKAADKAAAKTRAERAARQLRSLTAWHWMSRPLPAVIASLYIAATLMPLVAMGLMGTTGFIICSAITVAPIPVWLVARSYVRRAVRREQATLDAAPFRISGHWNALAQYSHDRKVYVRFSKRAPSTALLIDVLSAGLPPQASAHVEVEANTFVLVAPWTRGDHNRAYQAWFRELCALLGKLHDTYPIEWVRVDR